MISSTRQQMPNKKNIYSANESLGTKTTYDASLLAGQNINSNES